MFWLIGSFLTLTTLGGFTQVVRENRDLLVFGGVWALKETPGPNRQKNFHPQKIEKKPKFLFSIPVSKKGFSSKQSGFFSSSAPGAPYRGRAH